MRGIKLQQHGTTKPHEINVFEIVDNARRARLISTSKLIVALHSIPDDLAYEIQKQLKDPKQVKLFKELRAIQPTEFQPRTRRQKFFARLQRPKELTWQSYADKLNLDRATFWDHYGNMSQEIIGYLVETPQFANYGAAKTPPS